MANVPHKVLSANMIYGHVQTRPVSTTKRKPEIPVLQLLIQNHTKKKKQQHAVSHCYKKSTKESPMVYLLFYLFISINLHKICRWEQSMQHIQISRMSLHGLRFHKSGGLGSLLV